MNVPTCESRERDSTQYVFVAVSGEQVRDLGENNNPFKTNEGLQRCTTLRRASAVKPFVSMQRVVRAGNIVVLD